MTIVSFNANARTVNADEKATLISQALDTLRAANALDERDDLDRANWLAWYDATIPQVTDIKILAGAMEIELHRRRGEQILAEEERRGGDRKSDQIKVSHRDTLVNATKVQRRKDRAIAKAPARVKTYLDQEVAASRVPSMRGAMRAAVPKSPAMDYKTAQFKAGKERTARAVQEWIRILDSVADDERRTDAQLTAMGFDVAHFFAHLRFLPWLMIDRNPAGTMFVIDQELRAICEGRQPRPLLGNQSIHAFLQHLQTEIARRRKENHDEFRKRKWNSELILKREQTALLDWIEEQLLKVPT
jgi:hypothetical protein